MIIPKNTLLRRFRPDEKQAMIALAHEGKTLMQIVQTLRIDGSCTMPQLRVTDPSFANEISLALDEGLHALADGLIGITDRIEDVAKARLESDNARWLLSKRKAAIYGDRVDVNIKHEVSLTAAIADAKRRVIPVRDLNDTTQLQQIGITDGCDAPHTGYQPVIDAASQREVDIFS